MSTSKTKTSENKNQPLQLRYEQTTALYAAQFVITSSGDDVIINFSSGGMPDSRSGGTYLPVHTRIALTPAKARQLANLINQALSSSVTTPVTNEIQPQKPD